MSDNTLVRYSPDQLKEMAQSVVSSGMFPQIKNVAQAMTLFMLADANGLHPMKAALMFDVLPSGKPSMKGEALLAEFQARGGTVKWIKNDATECRAIFYSPGCPEGYEASFTIEDARTAQLAGKDNYRKFAPDMLRWRCVTRGVKATLPAAGLGLYPTEVAKDFEENQPKPVRADAEILADPGQDVEQKPLGQVLEAAAKRRAEAVLEYAPERFDEKNAKALGGLPQCCTAEGCPGTIGEFESEAKSMLGRRYFMCVLAFDERKRLLKAGYTNAKANAAVSKHYREWAEPWPRPEENEGAGSAPVSDPPESTPEPPAPHKEEWEEERARIVREVATKPGLSPAQRIDETGRRVNEALQRRLEEPNVKDKEEEREERQREAAIRDNF